MRGEIVHFTLSDVGAGLDLERIPRLFDRPTARAPLVSRSPLPRYPALAQPVEVLVPASHWGDQEGAGAVEIRLHALGVVAIRLRFGYEVTELSDLHRHIAHLRIAGKTPEVFAAEVTAEVVRAIGHARIEPYDVHVEPEPYLAFVLHDPDLHASNLLQANRGLVAALIEGEADPRGLAPTTIDRTLRHTIQYLANDAVVLGWDRAFIIAPDGQYEDVLDVMELANMELLELRTYDAYLDRRLDAAFGTLDRLWAQGGLFRSARQTLQEISEMRIEFSRLSDNLYDTHKLFGDWYVATIHSALAQRFHLDDWKGVVDAKMDTLKDLFASAQEEVNHRRALVLESMIVMLFIVDLVAIFALK